MEGVKWQQTIKLREQGRDYLAVLLSNTDNTFSSGMDLLKSPVWIGDTGDTTHSTFSKEAIKNQRKSTVSITGITCETIKPSIKMEIDFMYCDKNGDKNLR